MEQKVRRRLMLATGVYWFLLVYIVTALVWWFIVLENQNKEMSELKVARLSPTEPAYVEKLKAIEYEKERNQTKYVLEGITFLAVILVGAVFVYRAVRRQINMQQQQQNFMMAITHELKTPIAVAQLNLETLSKYQLDENKKQKLLQMTLQELKRLNDLANNVLVSSQLEDGRYKISSEEIDLSALVRNSLHEFKNRFPDWNWELDLEEDSDIEGDPLLIEIMVNNLLENAMKYSPRVKTIRAAVHKKENKVILQVSDEGPGIPNIEKQKIFQKFYRIGNEQTRTKKGTGLGLYLCKKIAEDHNADIFVTDNTPTGSNFIVQFNRTPGYES